jgi:hypothetical protein
MLELLSTLPHDPIDLLVLGWWVCRVVEEDKAGLLVDEPAVILNSLLKFASAVEEWEGRDFKTYFR